MTSDSTSATAIGTGPLRRRLVLAFGLCLSLGSLALIVLLPEPPWSTNVFTTVLFLSALSLLFGRVYVTIPRGILNLTAVTTQAAGMLLAPGAAALVGLVCAASSYSFGRPLAWPIRTTMWSAHVFWAVTGAALHSIFSKYLAGFPDDLIVVAGYTMLNWVVISLVFNFVYGEAAMKAWRQNLSADFAFAFVAYAAAALLLSSAIRLDSALGYTYGALVALLAMTLRSHLSLGFLQPFFQRSVLQFSETAVRNGELEGALHDVRNVLTTAELITADQTPAGELKLVLAEATAIARRALAVDGDTRATYTLVEVSTLCKRAAALVAPIAAQRRVSVSVNVRDDGTCVFGDATLLTETLTNVMANAIHASGGGGRVDVAASVRKTGYRVISVRDAGGGFYLGTSLATAAFATTRREGHGIGLQWCQMVALQHFGKLVVEQATRAGSTVTLSLPPPAQAQKLATDLRRRA